MKTERGTLDACMANLRALEAIKDVDVRERETGLPPGADAKLVLRTKAGQLVYLVEVKRTVVAAGLDHVLQQLQRYAHGSKAKPLLLSDYISPNLAERLIRAGVNFADAAGNVYLNWPGKLHIQIQGRKPKQIAEAKSERLTQPSGLRILYALLTHPPENWGTYRDIAKAAGVALGSIAVVMRELKAKGYLAQERRDEWRLTQKRKLLDLWVEGYGARLRPNLLIRRYQPGEANLEQTLRVLESELEDKKISWAITGGFAADILTHHFRGEQLSFFAQEWPLDLTRRLKWLPSDRGTVTVLRKFSSLVAFNLETHLSQPVAHPLLVYAELIFQGRERELETAKIIYDKYLSLLSSGNGT
ncbi:MAG: hypothetical protein GEU77_00975 [Deltaproteobacteria bacterium]|nr:hypothetical protein [Deltaproteobacteria bacterium]